MTIVEAALHEHERHSEGDWLGPVREARSLARPETHAGPIGIGRSSSAGIVFTRQK
jgi:hypothetical protein